MFTQITIWNILLLMMYKLKRSNCHLVQHDDVCMNDTEILKQIQIGHNRWKVPNGRVNVLVEVWVQAVSAIYEANSEFDIDVYITEEWNDVSLVFQDMSPCKNNISLENTMLRQFWYPKTTFINSRNGSIHESPFRNVFFMIYENGTAQVNYRIKLKGPCQKDLRTFPIDMQRCSLVYESYQYSSESVQLEWKTPPFIILNDICLPEYKMKNLTTIRLKKQYAAGEFDQLVLIFIFKRQFGFYVLQAYVPAYLTVLLSWISFHLGAEAIPSRTTIGVNALLTLSYQYGTIVANLPRTSEVKAIDVWVMSCMAFIFGSLLELAIIGFMNRSEQVMEFDCRCSWTCLKCPLWTAQKIDGFSAAVFPLAFAIFNVYYWCFFLEMSTLLEGGSQNPQQVQNNCDG